MIDASRSVIFAYEKKHGLEPTKEQAVESTRSAVAAMNADINGILTKAGKLAW